MLILHLHTNICSTLLFGNLSDNVSLDNLFFFSSPHILQIPSFYCRIHIMQLGHLLRTFLFFATHLHYPSSPIFLCYQSPIFLCYQKKKIHIKYNFPFLHFAYSVIIVFVEQSRTYIRALLKHVFFVCVFINSGIQVLQLMLCRSCSVNVLRCLKVCCTSFSLSC